MPDFAGAKAAMRTRFDTGWTTTPKAFKNEMPSPWPPVDVDMKLVPWVYFEVVGGQQAIAGTGQVANHLWTYEGIIAAHVFVPIGDGDALATQYAQQIGELFRAAKFYDATPGYCVRTLAPSIDDGDRADNNGDGDANGNWWRVTMTVDFTYWHRG